MVLLLPFFFSVFFSFFTEFFLALGLKVHQEKGLLLSSLFFLDDVDDPRFFSDFLVVVVVGDEISSRTLPNRSAFSLILILLI